MMKNKSGHLKLFWITRRQASNEVLLLWPTGEAPLENLSLIGDHNPITLTMYFKARSLLDKPDWKMFRRMAKQDKKFIRIIKLAQALDPILSLALRHPGTSMIL